MSALQTDLTMRGELRPGARRAYCLAGNAIVTIRSISTGCRYTYKITSSEGISSVYFVKLLTGPENTSNYQYIGTVFNDGFRITSKSAFLMTAPGVRAFKWFSENWEDERAEVWHEGVCGRCGRRLTVPESIASGIGPTCASR